MNQWMPVKTGPRIKTIATNYGLRLGQNPTITPFARKIAVLC